MLEFLRIKNFALIESAELEFSKGLNVITGESGAGKSIILKSLDFLLGQNMPLAQLNTKDSSTYVEAIFVLNNEEIIIKREISNTTKRSRIYINDQLSSKNTINELRQKLIIYTSQHEQQKLIKPEYHTSILDNFLQKQLLDKKHKLLNQLKYIKVKIKEIEDELLTLQSKKDLYEYYIKEIEKVNPQLGEDEILLKKREELKKTAKISENVEKGLLLLDSQEFSLMDLVNELYRIIDNIAQLDKNFSDLLDKIEVIKDYSMEINSRLRNYPVGIDQIKELENIEARLFEIEQLKKRLNKSLDEILILKEEMAKDISKIDALYLEVKKFTKQKQEIEQRLKGVISQLNNERMDVAEKLSQKLKKELLDLGFEKEVDISFSFFDYEIEENIVEKRAKILWRPNPGHDFQPLDKIVSGGELSRIFLALISVSAGEELPTLIFDEVDSGIGGITLTKVGNKLKELAKDHQIILITHWPQLASLANTHFMVKKQISGSTTRTICKKLSSNEIKQELARMAGGGNHGDALARELMQENV